MRFWGRGSVAVLVACELAFAQAPGTGPTSKNVPHTGNELTLAELRPGRDKMVMAQRLYGKMIEHENATGTDGQAVWIDNCAMTTLTIDHDKKYLVQVVRLAKDRSVVHECIALIQRKWKTGRGLRVGDSAAKVAELYGKPDSRSPSTKGGQPLELWYYAFDWAGADVPQVMEVLCTQETEGKPGRVVEITLAGPSL
jgi:hypothetical protein